MSGKSGLEWEVALVAVGGVRSTVERGGGGARQRGREREGGGGGCMEREKAWGLLGKDWDRLSF